MPNYAVLRHQWVYLGLALFLLGVKQTQGAINLGVIVVTNIGHTFRNDNPQNPNDPPSGVTTDWLIDQSHVSSDGSVLSALTVNLDNEETFVLKVTAPAGQKFWVHPTPGKSVALSAWLLWRAGTNESRLPPLQGSGTLTFVNLVGTSPMYPRAGVDIFPDNDFFLARASAGPMSNDLTFTSLILSNTIPHTNFNHGLLTYSALSYSSLLFQYAPNSTNDAGPMISLIPLAQPINAVVPLAEALDTGDQPLAWSSIGSGFFPWTGRLFVSHDGIDAAESGVVANTGAATLQGKVMGPGTLAWWWKVSSETNQDVLKLFVDGIQQTRISGEVNWRRESLHLDPGNHVLKWTYSKNGSAFAGMDKGWIDEVRYDPDTNCVFALSPAAATHDYILGTGSVAVATSPNCTWSVGCTNDWIVALSPLSTRGSGGVLYALMRNPTTHSRTGAVWIAGRSFPIVQAAGPTNLPPGFLRDAMDTHINPYYLEPSQSYLVQRSVTHDGVDAAQLGPASSEETDSIHAKVMGPGTLSFWWKVSSETNLDLLKFFGPEGEVRISGEVDWQYRSYHLEPGSNQVFWVYAKDESVSVGNDRGWLDQVTFVPDTNCPVAISPNGRRHGFGAEMGSIQVTASSNCNWSVWTASDWISIPLSITNVEDELVQYWLSPNATGQDRAGMIQLGNQTYTIFQTNGTCVPTLSATNAVHGWQRETGIVQVSSFPGCSWGVGFADEWITIHSFNWLDGNANLIYSVYTNPAALSRRGSVWIDNAALILLQAGQPGAPFAETNVLGTNQVNTIGHRFTPPGSPGLVSDFLIDQDQSSGGGAILPILSRSWNGDQQFAWKLVAPPGKKFVVQPPVGARARIEGSLQWEGLGGGNSPTGLVQGVFGGVLGTAPILSGGATLSDTHGFFGLTATSTPITNSFSFTSLTLLALVTPYVTGLGVIEFHPRLESEFGFRYETSQTTDPGAFVSLVNRDPPLNLRIANYNRTNGTVLVLQGPRLQTNLVQASSNLVQWTTISTTVMPEGDCPECPSRVITDRSALNAPRRFYRAVQK